MERAKQTSESIELGVLLALAGGFMDAYSYIARDGVFANAQTGNILLVGVNLSGGDLMRAGRYFFPVLAFALGIMLADLIHERFSSLFHWRQLTVFLEAVILLGVSLIPGTANLVANCLTSFACGMQVESFRKIHGHGIATTMCIGNLRSALQSVDDYIITHNKGFLENGLLYFGVILTFVVGAVLGNLCIGWLGLHAIAVAAVLLAGCFLIMFIDREAQTKKVQRLG
ncbi:YoaK family protein [uncultured Parolsenella sp.]|uniref:YoaK family protein n=1 Tax=uncultured Parolsenella sp. TaxID=2083008 RepID=UPI0027DB885A|nr:YoaK family protein [uncultured Parolsenella sp.]